MHDRHMRSAIVTGASRGLGLALTRELLSRGWKVVIDARDAAALAEVSRHLAGVVPVAGDMTDAHHRSAGSLRRGKQQRVTWTRGGAAKSADLSAPGVPCAQLGGRTTLTTDTLRRGSRTVAAA